MQTVLFFRHRDPTESDETLLQTLKQRFAGDIWVLPHIYDLPDECEEFREIRALDGPLYVLSWLPMKAAYWLLHKRVGPKEATCFDLQETTSPGSLPFLGGGTAKVRIFETVPKRRWYPVVNFDACQRCLECVNYCLFGVYTIGEGEMPSVEQPDQCRDGCPACSRVCPAGAILFPEYDDPIISGRAESKKPTGADDLDSLIDSVG